MEQPKFQIGQQVKFLNDHDRATGKILSFTYSSQTGYVYTVSSRYYDAEQHDMVEGHIICNENELIDMSDYAGTTEPAKPTKTVRVSDKLKK